MADATTQLDQGDALLAAARASSQSAALTQAQSAALLGQDPVPFLKAAVGTTGPPILRFAGTGTTSPVPAPPVAVVEPGAPVPTFEDPLFGPSPALAVPAEAITSSDADFWSAGFGGGFGGGAASSPASPSLGFAIALLAGVFLLRRSR